MDEDAPLSELLDAVCGSFAAVQTAIRVLVADTRRLEDRVRALKRPGLALHARRIPGRRPGRPRGSTSKNRHIFLG